MSKHYYLCASCSSRIPQIPTERRSHVHHSFSFLLAARKTSKEVRHKSHLTSVAPLEKVRMASSKHFLLRCLSLEYSHHVEGKLRCAHLEAHWGEKLAILAVSINHHRQASLAHPSAGLGTFHGEYYLYYILFKYLNPSMHKWK